MYNLVYKPEDLSVQTAIICGDCLDMTQCDGSVEVLSAEPISADDLICEFCGEGDTAF